MVLCFDLSAQANTALEALMQTGHYRDTSEAASMALVNYQVIQRAVSSGSPRVMDEAVRPYLPEKLSGTRPLAKAINRDPRIPELFRPTDGALGALSLDEVPDAAATQMPPALWFFGQFNKFLPVKIACRGLLNMLHESPGGVSLAEALEAISTEAWVLGDYLYMLDEGSSRSREDAFAAAFPTTAGNGARSRIRFANQFIGDLRQPKKTEAENREIKFNGLPAALHFIVCSDGKNPVLTLTRPGGEFAALANPILDSGAATPDRKFSEAETEFLLAHVRRAVPEETSAYTSIIDGINEGANTPDKLDNYLCRTFRLEIATLAETENQITQTFLTTQRTGAISRMVDLGLAAREKTGLRVTYVVTRQGISFSQLFH